MSKVITLYVFLLAFIPMLGQVGINTTDPQEMLHVNGKIRVDDVTGKSSTSVLGVDDDGTMNKMNVAGALEVHNNTIVASGTGYYSVVDIAISTPVAGTMFNNLDLGLDAANTYKTVIRFTGQTQNFEISGFTGGVEGRHIIILNSQNVNMGVSNWTVGSLPGNRIKTYAPGQADSTSGQGAIELVYDGLFWIVINKRN